MKECKFSVNREGREIAALCRGESGQRPILALHGWLDNAASFAMLAPHLEGCHLVALDLAGHGHSDHRGADGEYNIWNDLPDILAVADALGWDRFNLMGHSRGAIVSSILASTCPDRVSRLLLLDGWLPQAVPASECTGQLARWLEQRPGLDSRSSRVFASPEPAIELRSKNGLGADAARAIALRNLAPCDGGWRWSTDPRVQGASALKLTADHSAAIMAGLTMPALLMLADDGLGSAQMRAEYVGEKPNLEIATVAGGHHFHMEEPVQPLAERILEFLNEVPPLCEG